jgi:DNA-binding IclR family transcriptional regulator
VPCHPCQTSLTLDQLAVLNALVAGAPDLAEHTGLTVKEIHAACQELKEVGLIREEDAPDGLPFTAWIVTESGRSCLASASDAA